MNNWNDINSHLRSLYNNIATAHCETVAFEKSAKAEEEALNLMQMLTEKLNEHDSLIAEVERLKQENEKHKDAIAVLIDVVGKYNDKLDLENYKKLCGGNL